MKEHWQCANGAGGGRGEGGGDTCWIDLVVSSYNRGKSLNEQCVELEREKKTRQLKTEAGTRG